MLISSASTTATAIAIATATATATAATRLDLDHSFSNLYAVQNDHVAVPIACLRPSILLRIIAVVVAAETSADPANYERSPNYAKHDCYG